MIACFIYGKYVLYYRGKRNAIHDTEKGWCRYEYSRIIYSLVQQQAFKPGWNCHAEQISRRCRIGRRRHDSDDGPFHGAVCESFGRKQY